MQAPKILFKREWGSKKLATPDQRTRVLHLYKEILRLGHSWPVAHEQQYIIEEAKMLFRENQGLLYEEDVARLIVEAENRIALALHYQKPMPRPTFVPPRVPGDALNKE